MSKYYDNCKLFSKDDKLIGCCNKKKMMWYLAKGLGMPITDSSIKINFDHKIKNTDGEIDKYREMSNIYEKENKCVSCGDEYTELESFSLVPYEFKKCYPPSYKKYRGDLIILLCKECKADAQYFNGEMTNDILDEFGYEKKDIIDLKIVKLKIIAHNFLKGKVFEENIKILQDYMGDKFDNVEDIKKIEKMSPFKLFDGLTVYENILKTIMKSDIKNIIAFENRFIHNFYENIKPTSLPFHLIERLKN